MNHNYKPILDELAKEKKRLIGEIAGIDLAICQISALGKPRRGRPPKYLAQAVNCQPKRRGRPLGSKSKPKVERCLSAGKQPDPKQDPVIGYRAREAGVVILTPPADQLSRQPSQP